MEEEEPVRAAVATAIPFVQAAHALQGIADQLVVLGHGLVRSVGEVRQQGEPKARVGVGQVVRLQSRGERSGAGGADEHRGDHDHRRVLGRYPFLEVELGKDAGGQQQGEQMVDQPHRQLGERQQEGRHRQRKPPRDGLGAQSHHEDERQERRQQHGDPAEVDRARMAQNPREEPLAPTRAIAESGLQLRLAAVDQVETDVAARLARG